MAYAGEAWQQILTPFLQGIDGSLANDADELPWLDDGNALDPFRTQFDAEVQRYVGSSTEIRQEAVNAGRRRFRLPVAATKGEATADHIAASKGADPGPDTQGTGNMFDLARTMIGVPYVFGAATPDVAFDCSGFTKWLYSRSLGVALPHSAEAQAATLPKVNREDLQPGDLVFFSYGRKGPGVVDHVEVYMGNGKMIGTANPTDDLDIDRVDWSAFVGGGRPAGAGAVTTVGKGPGKGPGKGVTKPVTTTKRVPIEHNQALAPMALLDGPPAFAAVMDAIFAPDSVPVVTEKRKSFRGQGGKTLTQLRNGFIDAGRPDLARMVGTKDFKTWIDAEGGFNPETVSQYFPGHGVNYGIFQFWEGHDWTQEYVEGNRFTATPYQQAQFVAKYFGHLTPDKIREYADAVRAGDYHGWG